MLPLYSHMYIDGTMKVMAKEGREEGPGGGGNEWDVQQAT